MLYKYNQIETDIIFKDWKDNYNAKIELEDEDQLLRILVGDYEIIFNQQQEGPSGYIKNKSSQKFEYLDLHPITKKLDKNLIITTDLELENLELNPERFWISGRLLFYKKIVTEGFLKR